MGCWERTEEYQHGGAECSPGVLDFSANIGPLGLPETARAALRNVAQLAQLYPDPECRRLREAIGRFEGEAPERIVCGAGAADLIFRICHLQRPKRALLPVPSFYEYERALREVGCELSYLYCREEEGFSLSARELLAGLTEGIELLFLCNPSNPVGMLMTPEEGRRIAQRCRELHCFLVVDECFLDLVEEGGRFSARSWGLAENDFLIIKAFTKSFAMPGLRLGYGLCSEEGLAHALARVGPPWSVSAPALLAGEAALSEAESYLKETRSLLRREKDYLRTELSGRLQFYGGHANFLFFRAEYDLAERLSSQGIRIRDCRNFAGLGPGYYRIAVRGHEENEALVRAMKKSWETEERA